jgi:hypothetical protein
MAKTLEVKTMNGSRVIASTAGIESIAKNRSVLSIRRRANNKGVAHHFPSILTKK